ncbi:acyl-CoA dehydrogenase family protein [Stutzerimonas tarimensis]|uniref:Acyl-CoA dehydrogenase family protein n=1 Tax=Stutzerimonas tarimensis TaxID=1507735 RepID=A0ABV7TCJ0_9GAMM
MNFNLTDEQRMLQQAISRLVRTEYGFEHRQSFSALAEGFSSAFWQQLSELGLCAVALPEAYGGFGGGGVEVMLVMTELGRGLTLEPYLQSAVLGSGLLAQLGSEAQLDHWLPRLGSGEVRFAVAFEEPQNHYQLHAVQTHAERVEGGWRLSGRKAVVMGGHAADQILVSARVAGASHDPHGISVFMVDPEAAGVARRAYPTMDGRRASDLFLDDVFIGAEHLLGEPGEALAAMRYQQGRAIAAQCADMVGAMQVACELTLDYLKTRRQFGQPIGQFQALQHRMVDMQTELELATSMTVLAASYADADESTERSRALAAAKYICVRAGRYIAEQAIQLHGGIGLTWEYSLGHYAKRLVMASHELGDDDHHLDAYAALIEAA